MTKNTSKKVPVIGSKSRSKKAATVATPEATTAPTMPVASASQVSPAVVAPVAGPGRAVATRADLGQTGKRQGIITLLTGKGATGATTAVNRAELALAGYGSAVVGAMITMGHLAKTTLPTGGIGVYLTDKGVQAHIPATTTATA
jgi:hypothetical protein